MRPVVLIMGCLLLFCVVGCAGSQTASHRAGKTVDRRFSGTIRRIHFGACIDANNYIVIDNMKVVFASGGRPEHPERAAWGRMIGFSFPDSLCDRDFQGYDGKMAEALAAEDFSTGPKGEPRLFYSLYGDEKYYVKLLQ